MHNSEIKLFFHKIKKVLNSPVKVVWVVWRGFCRDNCSLHASALTYYTLMSLVPLFALGLSLARVFGAGDLAKEMIMEKIDLFCQELSTGAQGATASADYLTPLTTEITKYANIVFDSVANISFNTLGAIGLATLLWMAIAMLSFVERSFNSIWHAQGRKLFRKFSDYVTIILIVPFLAITASSIPIVAKVLEFAQGRVPPFLSMELFARLLRFGLSFTIMTMAFTIMFIFIPNTKVKVIPGLIGGFVTAIAFAIWFKLCTALQIGVAKNSAIYGGFAALPILLAWTYVSWHIILFGTELTVAVQRYRSFFKDKGVRQASIKAKYLVAISVTLEMAKKLLEEHKPLDVAEFAERRNISTRLVLDVMEILTETGIVKETANEDDGESYLLLHSPEKLKLSDITQALLSRGTDLEPLGLDVFDKDATGLYAELEKTLLISQAKSISELLALKN